MNKSESIKHIASALMCFHAKAVTLVKDGKNPHFKSRYVTLDNILETVRPLLAECGLAFTQFPTGQNGLTTLLLHAETGEYLEDTYTVRPQQDTPQGVGSSITYQRRYALAAILGLASEEDDDGNAASTPPKAQPQPAKPAAPAKPDLGDWGIQIDDVRDMEGANDLLSRIRKAFPTPDEGKPIKSALNQKCASLRLRFSTTENAYIHAAA